MLIAGVFGWVRRAAHGNCYLALLAALAPCQALAAASVTLAWNRSTDPAVTGYKVYYGIAAQNYTNSIDAGTSTNATIAGLANNVTYYFAATAYTADRLESPFSAEATYSARPPVVNQSPTLNALADLSVKEDSGLKAVNLTGITSGSTNESQPLSVAVTSSDPAIIPNPTVTYTSPSANGTVTLQPAANAFGSSVITVMVDDGGAVSNTIIRSFTATVTPVNDPPTLAPIANQTVDENAAAQTVLLTGITSGPTNEAQICTVTASSSNPTIVPNPTITYSNANSSGLLSFAPALNAFGSANITVTVNDGQSANNTTSRVFAVTVNQGTPIVTNAIIAPGTCFEYCAPTNGHRLAFSLDAGAPPDATIDATNGVVSWIPSRAKAGTTNSITIRTTDNDAPSQSASQSVRVIVLDYIDVGLGTTNLLAGQSTTVPIYLESSAGITNLSCSIKWPSNRFTNATIFAAVPGIASSSAVNQGTNLLVTLQTTPGQPLLGSNVVAQLNFQTLSNQKSAFVSLPPITITGNRADGTPYVCSFARPGEVAVVKTEPLLRGSPAGGPLRSLAVYGKPGTNYQLQCMTALSQAPSWSPLTSFTQTNVLQTLNLNPTNPVAFYRLLQQ